MKKEKPNDNLPTHRVIRRPCTNTSVMATSSSHSRHSDSGSNRESRSNNEGNSNLQSDSNNNSYESSYRDPYAASTPAEEGIEVMTRSRRPVSRERPGRNRLGSKDSDLSMSQHTRENLTMVPELPRSRNPYDSQEFGLNERSSELPPRNDNSGELSRADSVSKMSVMSDMSYGDKPFYSSSALTMGQDSGIYPHLNSSQKSSCSMTVGSKRMAERKAFLIKNGSIVDCDAASRSEEFTRWGGRRDYAKLDNSKKKKKEAKLHKSRLKANAKADAQANGIAKRKERREGRNSEESDDTISHGFHDLWGFAFKKEQLEYDQLIENDKHRELVASYCEQPFWKIIFHFQGTVLRVIIEDILFWLTLASYVSCRITIRMNPGTDDAEDFKNLSGNLSYVGGFLLFFLVFYVNQNHHRYFQLHNDSMILMGRVNDVATLVKAILPMERARRINRYMNAAHIAMYTGLSETYEKENFFDPLEQRFALLTDEELFRVVDEIDVDKSGAKAAYEIITWIMCDIRDAQLNNFIDTNEAMQLREQLLDFRSTISKIFVTTTLPIPFFYVHFLSMLTAVYLPLFAIIVAYETGADDTNTVSIAEAISLLVIILQALFVIGLRILGQQLSDPYGGDLIDLQVARYVNMILNGSNQILAAKRLYAPSIETELRLQLQMSSLGQAFEYDTDDENVVQH